MIRGLRVVMTVWAALGIVLGLGLVFMPEQLGSMQGYARGPAYIPYFLALLGTAFIALGVFLIVAARDPLKNILWVRFAIVWAILAVIVEVSSVARGLVTFTQVGMGLIIDLAAAIALLALYPWRGVPIAKQAPDGT